MNQQKYGCIGKKLTHSFSKEIHARLADYDYELIELAEDAVGDFLIKRDFAAINVTIPYKETVIPYLDSIDAGAAKIGAVNTIVNRDGKLYGYNTDYYGMRALIERIGVAFAGKKVLVLGTGGTSKTARVVAADLGAAEILVVSRHPADDGSTITYADAVAHHTDADVILNTTPVGMYPQCDAKPIELAAFPQLRAVVDAVYNPLRTQLIEDAQEREIPAQGGLYMLVMQAVAAVFREIYDAKENIVLTGMPGSGKSTVGRLLASESVAFVDTDAEIEKRCGCTIREYIRENGEEAFRDLESAVIRDISREGGQVIATGGGAILRQENVRMLRQNGRICYLDAPLSRLIPTDDRPLSDTRDKLTALYTERLERYKKTADCIVPAMDSPAAEAAYIAAERKERTI